jgi:DNA helicase-2/ATP-dependent DNA helicase PcrA
MIWRKSPPVKDTTHPLLANLNPVQREAVQHTEGPLLIFAGAGSGKTRVLTHRVAWLIAEKKVAPYHILAVTFTNKAAQEMRERIVRLVGEESRSLWIGTFHATCARILRESGSQIGLERDFVVYDDGDQMTVVRDCLFQLQLDEKKFAPRAVLSHISRAKEKLITPEEFPNHFRGFFEDICARIYPLYRDKLKQNKALDFDDLLMMTVRLFEQRPEVLERWQNRFRYILVDEYQDVNFAQYRFLRLVASKYNNLAVVGDDDQSIYQFRGADVGLILQFEKDYPDAKVIKLEQNYRSTRTILDAAHGVVSKNRTRAPKRLWTENAEGVPIRRREADNEQEEAVFIVETIRAEVRSGRRRFGDFAILYRTNAQSRAFEQVFANYATPYRIVGGVRFYERREVKDVLAYLRVLQNPQDDIALKRILNVPTRGIGDTTVSALTEQAQALNRSLWDTVMEAHLIESLQPRARKALTAFAALILELRALRDRSAVTALTQAVLERTGYLSALEQERTIEAQARAENVRELLTVTTEFDATAEDRSLSAFLEQVSLVSDLDSLDTGADAVTMMTLHAAKGLEFPVVFLAGMEEGIFPHLRSMNSDRELEEERRLCYVGITRAKEELYLTHAYRRMLFGSMSSNAPSRFLREIPEELYHIPPVSGFTPSPPPPSPFKGEGPGVRAERKPLWVSAPTTPVQEKARAAGKNDFRVGQKVKHETFGIGVVLSVKTQDDGDIQVSVAFPNHGVKKLLQSFAKLKKLS